MPSVKHATSTQAHNRGELQIKVLTLTRRRKGTFELGTAEAASEEKTKSNGNPGRT
jgi:hypothetical protein